jgi:hypothetical protein
VGAEHNLTPGRPPGDWADRADVDRLVSKLMEDANELVWAAEDLELNGAQADAVALLALVAGQDVAPRDGPGRWRIARRTAPDRTISTVDPETRQVNKNPALLQGRLQGARRGGARYRAGHTCELTAGNIGDAEAAPGPLDDEPAGTEVLGDSAYGTGELRHHVQDRDMTAVIKPRPLRPAVEGGYTLRRLRLRRDRRDRHLPGRHHLQITAHRRARFGRHSSGCLLRSRCTTAARGGGEVTDAVLGELGALGEVLA